MESLDWRFFVRVRRRYFVVTSFPRCPMKLIFAVASSGLMGSLFALLSALLVLLSQLLSMVATRGIALNFALLAITTLQCT